MSAKFWQLQVTLNTFGESLNLTFLSSRLQTKKKTWMIARVSSKIPGRHTATKSLQRRRYGNTTGSSSHITVF